MLLAGSGGRYTVVAVVTALSQQQVEGVAALGGVCTA